MNRLSLLAALAASATSALAQPIQIAVPAQPVPLIDPLPSTPQGQPKPREDVKVDPKTNPDPKSLEIPPEQLSKARELVRQFGNPSYRERENATREIQKMGRAGLPALVVARETETSPEVRLRTEICLPFAEADDMKAKVACFLADADAKFDHSLPGWNKFKGVVGNDKTARELFADVLKKKDMHALLMAAELPPNDLSQVLNNHYKEIINRQNGVQFAGRGYIAPQQPTTPEIIVLAFLEGVYSDKDVTLNYNYGYAVTNYLYQPDFQNAMTGRGGKYAEPIKKVLTRWMDTRETGQGAQFAMQFAQQWNMQKEMTKYAGKVLLSETQQGNWWVKTNALSVLGQRGAKDQLEVIAKVFEDSTNVNQGGAYVVPLGDFALGVALNLSGQNPKDYGMEVVNNGYKWNQNNYYFKDDEKAKADEKRKAAHKKWEEWFKKEKEKEKDVKKDEPKKDEPKPEEKKNEIPQGRLPVRGGPIPLPAPVKPVEKN